MPANTVHLHRVLRCAPDRLYRAFLGLDARAKWLPPQGFAYTYVKLKPNQHLRYTDHFDDPSLLSEITVTVTLKPVLNGTDLSTVQEGIRDAIPVERSYLGWQDPLT